MVYVITIILLIICLTLQVIFVKNRGIASLFNNPASLSLIFYELIHLIMPLLQWYYTYFRYDVAYDETIYSLSIILVFVQFLIYISIFFYYKKYFSNINFKYTLNSSNLQRMLILSWLVFLIGIYFSSKTIMDIKSIGVDVYLRDRIGFSSGSGYKILFGHWVYISCLLFFIGYMFAVRKTLFLLSFILSIVYCFIYYSLNSNRNSLFVLAISIFVLNVTYKPNFKLSNLISPIRLSIIMIFLIAFYAIGKFRNTTLDTSREDRYGLVSSLNGAFGNHENIVWLLNHNQKLLLGDTYIAALLNVVPRSIWVNKPYGAGPELKNMIYPGSYILGQEGNSSLTTGLFTEVIMNFGVFGSLPFISILALIVFLVLVSIKKISNPFGQIIYIYLFILFSTQFMYAEFLGFYTRTLFTCIPFILLSFFIKFERKYN